LLGNDFAAGLQNIVERNFQLLGIGLEQIVDLLLCGSQVELDVFQTSLGVSWKLFGSLLHVLVCHEGADHTESAVINSSINRLHFISSSKNGKMLWKYIYPRTLNNFKAVVK